MKKILLIPLFLLSGCATVNGITNEEVVEQTKFCEDNGFEAVPLTSGFGVIVKIQCSPKKSNDDCEV